MLHSLRIALGCTLLVTIVASLGGCAIRDWLVTAMTPAPKVHGFRVSADGNANYGFPTAVDLVIVRNTKAMAVVGSLKASEWFASKADYERQFENGLSVYSWEVVSGQRVLVRKLSPPKEVTVGVYIFANFLGSGTFRADVTAMGVPQVTLRRQDFTVRDANDD